MKTAPYYILALAMAVPAALVGIEIPSWFAMRTQTMALQSDLRVFYAPGYMLRTGQRRDLYNFPAIRRTQDQQVASDNAAVPFLHPAYEAVAFVPISMFPYRTAYLLWAAVNFGVLTWIYLLLRPLLRDISAVGPDWIPAALLLGFMPIAFTIMGGQDSLFLLLVLVLVYRRIESNELQAGVLLGIGMFRFQVLLPIVALFLLWRHLKFVAGWVAGSAVVLGLSAAITGVTAQAQYLELLRRMGGISIWMLIRRMPNLRGLFTAWSLGLVPLILLSVAVFGVVAVIGAKLDVRQQLRLAISVSTLVTFYLFTHDVSILALPLLVALNEAVASQDWIRAGLVTASLSGFAIFWFARESFYLGAIFTMLFVCVQIAHLIKHKPNPSPRFAAAAS